jgi:hypothetical protein
VGKAGAAPAMAFSLVFTMRDVEMKRTEPQWQLAL